jgi:hypothetical protein
MDWWEMLLDDAAATAAEYEDRGWETLELHTADVTPLDGEFDDRVGLSVLVPDDEFETLRNTFAGSDIDGFEAYRTEVMGYVALLLVLEDETDQRAVVVPVYYSTGEDAAENLFAQALADGELSVYLRNLAEDRVAVTLADPEPLAPPETDGDENAESPSPDEPSRD